MINKILPSILPAFILIFGVLTAVFTGCAQVGDEVVESSAPMPRWVWTSGNGDYSVIVDRHTHEKIRDVTPEEAFGIIYSSSDSRNPVVIDVRTPEEYVEGYIDNAINIDYNSDSFMDEINSLDRDKTYVIYCRSGRRSAAAQDVMEELGFKNVINITGGILEWDAEELPVVK